MATPPKIGTLPLSSEAVVTKTFPGPTRRGRLPLWAEWAGVSLLFLALSAVYTYPLCLHPATYLTDLGDPLQHISVAFWTSRKLLSGHWAGMWNLPPMYYPAKGTLAYGDPQFGTTLLGLPIFAATGNIVLAYNVFVLISIPLCALGAYALVRHLTRSRAAALFAAVVWGFATWHNANAVNQQILSLEVLPFLLLMLHRYGETRQARFLIGVFVCWLIQEFLSSYWGAYLVLLIAPFALLLLRVTYRLPRRNIEQAGVVIVLAVVPWFLVHLPVLAGTAQGRRHPLAEVMEYSADLADYLPARGSWLWGNWGTLHVPPGSHLPAGEIVNSPAMATTAISEFMVSPGLIALLLAGLACLSLLRYERHVAPPTEAASEPQTPGGRDETAQNRPAERFWTGAVRIGPYLMLVSALAWLTMQALGVGSLEVLGLSARLVNERSVFDGFWLGLLAFYNKPVRAFLYKHRLGFRDIRSPMLPYAALALLAVVWSCGYEVRFHGITLCDGIHGYLSLLPGTRSFRALCRMGCLADLALAVLAAGAFAGLWRKWIAARHPGPAARVGVCAGVCLLVLAESVPRAGTAFSRSGPVPPLRAVDQWLARRPAGAVVELPLTTDPHIEGERLWHQLTHQHPMRNGYVTFYPKGYYPDVRTLVKPQSEEAIARLRELGIRYVLLDTDNRDAGRSTLLGKVARMPAALSAPYGLCFTEKNVKVYELSPASPVPASHKKRLQGTVAFRRQGNANPAQAGAETPLPNR